MKTKFKNFITLSLTLLAIYSISSIFTQNTTEVIAQQEGTSECLIKCGGKCWPANPNCPIQGKEGLACNPDTGRAYCKHNKDSCEKLKGHWCPQTPDKCWYDKICAEGGGEYKCVNKGEFKDNPNHTGGVCYTNQNPAQTSSSTSPQSSSPPTTNPSSTNTGGGDRPTYYDGNPNSPNNTQCCLLKIPFTNMCLVPGSCATSKGGGGGSNTGTSINPGDGGSSSTSGGASSEPTGGSCNPSTQKDQTGACNSACCSSDSDCPGSKCSVGNGYCASGKSCYDTERPNGGGPASQNQPSSNYQPPRSTPPRSGPSSSSPGGATPASTPPSTDKDKDKPPSPTPDPSSPPETQRRVGWGEQCGGNVTCNSSNLSCQQGQCLQPAGSLAVGRNCRHALECNTGVCGGTCEIPARTGR